MRFEAIEIDKFYRYSFVIETRDKPDREIKEHIRAQIREAMEALGREPDSYSVTVSQGSEENPGEREFPTLEGNKNYLLFAFRSSGEVTDSRSLEEIGEEREELARGIFAPRGSRIALVLLQDSSLSVIKSEYNERRVLIG